MDRKSLIILAICAALLLTWTQLIKHYFPAVPVPTNAVAQATSPLPADTNRPAGQSTTLTPVLGGTNGTAPFVVRNDIPEQLVTLTNEDARYVFTSRGGGLREVELLKYPESVSSLRRRRTATNEVASLNSPAVPPVLSLLGTANETLQGDGVFQLTRTNGGVRAEKTLANGLAVIKEFKPGSNYLMSATVRLENRSSQPVELPAQSLIAGTAMPMGPQDDALTTLGIHHFNGADESSVGLPYFATNTTKLFVLPRTPKTEYRATDTNVVWVSAQNRFFALVTMPKQPAPGLTARAVNLPPPSQEEIASNPRTVKAPRGLVAALDYPPQALGPNQSIERTFSVFAGPKEYRTLSQISRQFNNGVDRVMGFHGFWSFGLFAKTLLRAMNWMHHRLLLPYGWTIILITVLIKLIFWPLTQYSTRSMKRMQALQPQMKALQEKYKDDPQKQQQKLLEFYRKNKVNPFGSCLPALVQVPVFIGFYRMLQSAIELRGAPFLWIGDLSKPDTVFVLPGFNFPVNPMPLIMGASMLWQSHMMPPSPGMDPSQQKLMRYMPLIMLLFLYNYSSALALYWTVNNLLTVLQTWLTRTQTTPEPAAASAAPATPPKKKK